MNERMRYVRMVALAVSCAALLGCGHGLSENELVMCEGMQIRINAGPAIKISAVSKTFRKYEADGLDVTMNLIPRSERWYGSLGLYRPSGTWDLHMVLEEGQQHFWSETESLDWLAQLRSRRELNVRYSSDGLVIAWQSAQGILRTEVWQIYVQGKKPRTLPGASDSAVLVYAPTGGSPDCAAVGNFKPSAPAVLNGRSFSGYALDIMHERGATAGDVEKVVSNGTHWRTGDYDNYLTNESLGFPTVVTLDTKGVVVWIN